MAWNARSKRVLLAGLGDSGTNPELGPGTYVPPGGSNNKAGVPTWHTPVKKNATSFNYGAERKFDMPSFVTPGPGRYVDRDRPTAADLINQAVPSSQFASNTIRFNPKAMNPGQPGPGQYQPPEGISEKAKKVAAQASTQGGFGSTQAAAISWKRMSTAPSIPAKHQSFGFRKSADSGVVPLNMKGGPAGSDEVGGSLGTTPKTVKGADFSRSKTERFKAKKADAYPVLHDEDRAGSQASNKTAPSRMRMRPPDRDGPSYAETVARKKLEEAAAVPGPGAYAPPSSVFEKHVDSNHGAFNVTAKRFSDKNQTGDLGPGEHTDGLQKATKAIKIKERHPASLHTTPFGVTAGRFGKQSAIGQAMAGGVPGPGSYTQEDAGFLSAQQDKTFGRFEGGFGSASERFTQESQQYSADLGPGAYEGVPDPETSKALQKRRHRGGLSSLDSGVSREKVIKQSLNITDADNQPGPGDYLISSHVGKQGPPGRQDMAVVAETPFGVTVKRWGDGKTKSTINNFNPPGPGTYDEREHARDGLPRRGRDGKFVENATGCFGVTAQRFSKRNPGEGRRTKQPGPGQYSDGVKAATAKWRTPTFNVSIKRSEANAKIVEVL